MCIVVVFSRVEKHEIICIIQSRRLHREAALIRQAVQRVSLQFVCAISLDALPFVPSQKLYYMDSSARNVLYILFQERE